MILTDSPEVAELKTQFRALDEQEEKLKSDIRRLKIKIESVRAQKMELTKQIFKIQPQ